LNIKTEASASSLPSCKGPTAVVRDVQPKGANPAAGRKGCRLNVKFRLFLFSVSPAQSMQSEPFGVARAACFEILVASVRECVQTGTHAHDLLQYDGLCDTVGANLKAFPYPRLFFQWHIIYQPTFSVDPGCRRAATKSR